MTVGERMQAARKRAGMKQSDLAERLGVAVITVGQYERDKRQPRLDQFSIIASTLGVDVNWLMNGQTLEQRNQSMRDYVDKRFTEAELGKRLQDSYMTLTLEGKKEVVNIAEIIAGNPRYQAQPAPQSTLTSNEGKDTPPPQNGVEGLPEDE